jgi:hypothetical protein
MCDLQGISDRRRSLRSRSHSGFSAAVGLHPHRRIFQRVNVHVAPDAAADKMRCCCRLAYQELVGGVLNMRTEHFQRVNGYSNLYWGWGAEDDDMAYRYVSRVSIILFSPSPVDKHPLDSQQPLNQ